MQRTRQLARMLIVAASPLAYVACSTAPVGEPPVVIDERVLPPASRTFDSPSKTFTLVVSTADQWKTPQARASLRAPASNPTRTVWEQTLPQENGPRRAMVSDRGVVVLIDEWINVPSRYALMALDASGQRLANYSLDDLITVLEVPRRAISDHATLGIWLSAEPVLSGDGQFVLFRVAGRGLTLQLSDGRITATN